MTALYIFAGLSFVLWLYCRFCYYVLRQPTDTFWRFLRRDLIPRAAVPVQIIDLLIKALLVLVLFNLACTIFGTENAILWQLF